MLKSVNLDSPNLNTWKVSDEPKPVQLYLILQDILLNLSNFLF